MASDADGGGIQSWGDLTVRSSVIADNRASAVAPHGLFAEGGGIRMGSGTQLLLVGSAVNGNRADLASTNPVTNPDGSSTGGLANSGGIHVDDGSHVTIRSSHIDENVASVDNPQGRAAVLNSALQLTLSDLSLTDTSVSHNRAIARVHDSGDQGPLGGALQACSTDALTGLRAVGNSSVITAVAGDSGSAAAILAGATICNGFDPGPSTLTNSVVLDNTSTALASSGRADGFGAGIVVASSLTMRGVVISGNRGFANGSHGGEVQGGGIWNGAYPLPFLEGLHSNLALDHVLVTRNSVSGSATEGLAGGGVYTRDPITRTATIILANRPDQCFGCADAHPSDSFSRTARRPAPSNPRGTSNLRAHIVGESQGTARR